MSLVSPPRLNSHAVRYAIGVACALLSLGLRAAIDPLVGDQVPFVTIFAAVAAAAWVAGRGPAVLASVLGLLGANILFIEPRGEVTLDTVPTATGALASFFSSAVIIGMSDLARRTDARRRRAEEALRAAADRKDEFLAILSHELRTPLTPITFAVDALRGNAPVTPRLVEIIDRQLKALTRLIDDLLDVSRITRGKIELRKERIDLNVVVARAVEAVAPRMTKHVLTVVPATRPLVIDGDPLRLEQVVANLLTNAARHTPPGSRVEVSLVEQGGQAILEVKDDGPGISDLLRPRLFEFFEQGDDQRNVQGGLGVGLALVRALLELHGGQVSVRMPGLPGGKGPGCVFSVVLPGVAPPSGSFGPP